MDDAETTLSGSTLQILAAAKTGKGKLLIVTLGLTSSPTTGEIIHTQQLQNQWRKQGWSGPMYKDS